MKNNETIKKYEVSFGNDSETTGTLYVGCTADIKAMYGSIYRAWKKWNRTDIIPSFTEKSRFNLNKSVYGITIDQDGFMTVVNSETVAIYLSGLKGYTAIPA